MIRHALFAGVLNYEKLITPGISGAAATPRPAACPC